jgi:hypothetical protein
MYSFFTLFRKRNIQDRIKEIYERFNLDTECNLQASEYFFADEYCDEYYNIPNSGPNDTYRRSIFIYFMASIGPKARLIIGDSLVRKSSEIVSD